MLCLELGKKDNSGYHMGSINMVRQPTCDTTAAHTTGAIRRGSHGNLRGKRDVERWPFCLVKWAISQGQKYIFAAGDVFTRAAYAEPMTATDRDSCGGALMSIILEHKATPRVLLSDSDAAYTSAAFKEVPRQNNIAMNTVVVWNHKAMDIKYKFAKRLKFIFDKQKH